jgi:hypothetical protein
MRKIRVMIVDDEEADQQRIESVVYKVVPDPELVICDYAVNRPLGRSKGLIASEELQRLADKGNYVDVLIADSALPGGSTVGINVLEQADKLSRLTRLFFVTKHYENAEEYYRDVGRIFTDVRTRLPRVVPVSKNRLDILESKLREEVETWTTMVSRGIDRTAREKIRTMVKAKDSTVEHETIRVAGDDWLFKNMFSIYWLPDKRWDQILDCLRPDLTLSFSRAFGLWGVKQITHDNAGMYFDDSADEISRTAKLQLSELGTDLLAIGNLFGAGSNVQRMFEVANRNLKEFVIPENSTRYDSDLRNKREMNFQFKGEYQSATVLGGKIFEKLNGIANSAGISLNVFQLGGSIVDSAIELHVPVHEFYEDKFNLLFQKIKCPIKGAGVDSADLAFWSCKSGHSDRIGIYNANIYENYIIIRNTGRSLERARIVGEDPPTIVSCFASEHFGNWGRFYIGLKQTNELFDCTFSPPQQVDAALLATKVQEEFAYSSADFVTYYVFVFSCWRPVLAGAVAIN